MQAHHRASEIKYKQRPAQCHAVEPTVLPSNILVGLPVVTDAILCGRLWPSQTLGRLYLFGKTGDKQLLVSYCQLEEELKEWQDLEHDGLFINHTLWNPANVCDSRQGTLMASSKRLANGQLS